MIEIFGSEDLGRSYTLINSFDNLDEEAANNYIKNIQDKYSRWYSKVNGSLSMAISKTLLQPILMLGTNNTVFITEDVFILSLTQDEIKFFKACYNIRR